MLLFESISNYLRIITFAILLLFPFQAIADCLPLQMMSDRMQENGMIPFSSAIIGENHLLIFLVNYQTQQWIIVGIDKDIACVILNGSSWEFVGQES